MNKYHTITIGGEEYKLRLSVSAIKSIEKKLGKSIIAAFENTEENIFETITTILWGAMQPFNANFTVDEVDGLLDQYFDDGYSIEDLTNEIKILFEMSGFFRKGQAT